MTYTLATGDTMSAPAPTLPNLFRHGFFWITSHADAKDIVKKYISCQKSTQVSLPCRLPLKFLSLGHSPPRGSTWADPFKRTQSGLTHLLIVIDKFIKWVEAKPNKKLYGPTATTFSDRVDLSVLLPAHHNHRQWLQLRQRWYGGIS
jgi:hypothetical protein